MATKKQLEAIAKIAGAIVLEVPRRRTGFSPTTYVRMSLINKLEATLEAAGYDMTAARAEFTKQKASAAHKAEAIGRALAKTTESK